MSKFHKGERVYVIGENFIRNYRMVGTITKTYPETKNLKESYSVHMDKSNDHLTNITKGKLARLGNKTTRDGFVPTGKDRAINVALKKVYSRDN